MSIVIRRLVGSRPLHATKELLNAGAADKRRLDRLEARVKGYTSDGGKYDVPWTHIACAPDGELIGCWGSETANGRLDAKATIREAIDAATAPAKETP